MKYYKTTKAVYKEKEWMSIATKKQDLEEGKLLAEAINRLSEKRKKLILFYIDSSLQIQELETIAEKSVGKG